MLNKNHFYPLNEKYFSRQVIASSSPILATVAAGMTSGYSAILLPQLQERNSSIPITNDDASWIASMAALPMSVGCIFGGILMERYGRRSILLMLNVPFLISWILIATAGNLHWLLFGRFISGLSVGLLGPPAAVYIGETSEPRYRGFLLAAVSLAIAIGILVTHILGTFLSWKLTAIICGILPLISFSLAYITPESPSWLLSKGRIDEARTSFQWLRGYDDASKAEFDSILTSQNTSATVGNYSWISIKENIRRPAFVKPLGILLGFFFTMQCAGVNAVAFYSVSIIEDTIGKGINKYLAMIVIDVVRAIMSVVACVLLRRVGRRPLVLISGTGTTISLLGLSAFLYVAAHNTAVLQHAWIPLSLLIGFITFVSIGIVPLPWCMTGELFPLALRGLGSGIVTSFNFLCLFAVVKTGPIFFFQIGAEGAFLIYGTVALLGTMFLIACLPETKDRTLQEIENSFEGSKIKEDAKKGGQV